MAYRVFQFLRILKFTVVYTILLYLVVLLQLELVRNLQKIPDLPLEYNLENILKSQVQPKDGQNIFFIETSRVKHKKERLFTARQACAVESAGLTNPHLNIFVLFVSLDIVEWVTMSPVMNAIMSYPNVHFNSLDIKQFSTETPLQSFIESGRMLKSKFVVAHTSDALRFLLLWRYGGTYLDTDMIVKKKLDSIPPNYACDDISDGLNGAILNIASTQEGHRLAEIFLKDVDENFDGEVWGPELITRVLQNLCKTKETSEMVAMKSCEGFHVLEKSFCYPITGVSWAKYFDESFATEATTKLNDSLVVHFWNNLSKKSLLSVNSNAAYVQLAKQFCPKVIAACGEYF